MISAASLSASGALILGGGGFATARWARSASANSGKSARVFHSLTPSDQALVCALARPSASHLRTCSTGTGPYSLWSAPMILYIIVLSQSENTNTWDEVAKIRMTWGPGGYPYLDPLPFRKGAVNLRWHCVLVTAQGTE